MENSYIISFFIHIISILKKQYEQSYLKCMLDRMFAWLQAMKEGSLIIRAIGGESKLSQRWRESKLYGIVLVPLNAVKRLLCYCWNKAEKLIKGSRILSATDTALSNLFNYSLRTYGVLLLTFVLVEAALWISFQENALRDIALRALLILIALIMLLLDIPVAALFKGSSLYRFAESGFTDGAAQYDDRKPAQSAVLSVVIVIGVVLGVLAYLLPIKLMGMAAAGVLIAVLTLWRYEFGVFLAAGFAALLPTSALFFVMGLTIFSFLFRWAVGKLPKYRATPVDSLMVLFFIALCYSTITSYFIKDSMNVLFVHTLMLAFYFVLTRAIDSRYKLYLLVVLLSISAALTSLYGIYQYYGGAASTEAWVDTTMFEDIQSRVGSTFNNPNILGEYLIMMIPLCLSLLWYKKKFIYKAIFMAMLLVMGVCMLYTFSRGAWLGLILALVGFSVVKDKRLFALMLVALFIMPFVLPPSVMNRFTSIGNLQDTSSSYRMSILMGSLRMAQDYWITGIGLGSQAFKAIYPKYSLAAAYAHHSHNVYLQIMLEMGITGTVVFMLIILVFVRATLAHQSKTRDSFLATIMIAACAGVAGYLVQGLVENVWYNYRVLQTFWVVLALGLCALKLAKEEVQTND